MGKISSGEKFLRFRNPAMEEPKTRKKQKKLEITFLFLQKFHLRLHWDGETFSAHTEAEKCPHFLGDPTTPPLSPSKREDFETKFKCVMPKFKHVAPKFR